MENTQKLTGSPDEILKFAFAMLDARRLNQARNIFYQIMASYPKELNCLFGLGVIAYLNNEKEQAQSFFEEVLRQDENHTQSRDYLASLFFEKGDFAKAKNHLEKIISRMPQSAVGHYNLGLLYQKQSSYDEALEYYKKSLSLDPAYIDAAQKIKEICETQKLDADQKERAEQDYKRALELKSKDPVYWLGLAERHYASRNDKEAEICYHNALALNPNNPALNLKLADFYQCEGQWEKSKAFYEKTLSLDRAMDICFVNLGLLQLRLGNFKEGFENYQHRKKIQKPPIRFSPQLPEWDGLQPLKNKKIFLIQEQGYGDYIQFVRFSENLKSQGATVIAVHDSNIGGILKTVPWVSDVYSSEQFDLEAEGFQVAIADLPRYFHVDSSNIPHNLPYIFADTESKHITEQFPEHRKKRWRIGLSWEGNQDAAVDPQRYMQFSAMLPLLEYPEAEFYSLVVNDYRHDLVDGHQQLKDMRPFIKNFSDTATIIKHLDLVICVDTSLAHLTGAMNKPCWVLLPAVPDWRWQLNRSDSPWYPSLTLFRQTKRGDWDSVIQAVMDALNAGGLRALR